LADAVEGSNREIEHKLKNSPFAEAFCSSQFSTCAERFRHLEVEMSGLFGSSSSAAATQNNTLGDLSKDVTVKNPPEDSISDLAFSSQSEHLAVASWDNKVRIYEVAPNGEAEGKAALDFKGPVLSCAWSKVIRNNPKVHMEY
jgi:WD40 repeat protein